VNRIRPSANAAPVLGLLSLTALFATSALVSAQAWVPPAHVGSVSLGFQWIDNTGHLLNDGQRDFAFPGGSRDASLYLVTEYAFTDRLSVEVGLPYVFAKYTGPGPTPGFFFPVDSCFCWHSGFQDFGLITRYNAIGKVGGAFALTPSVAVGAPSRNYDFQGEAVVGRNLKEIALAVDAGERLDAISPRLSIQGHYSYAFVERVLNLPNNRSNFAVEAAYQLTRKLAVRGLASWQWTHGGLRVPEDITMENFPQHDRLLRNNYFHLGAGVSYQLPELDVYATYIGFVNGRNTHAGKAVSVGVSWPFELGREH
jgi:hypothetical protein